MNTKPLRQFYGIVINSAVNGYLENIIWNILFANPVNSVNPVEIC
jgi:hypothetical protein